MSERLKIRILGFASYLLGYVSVICGYSLLSFLVFAFTYIFSDPGLLGGRSWRVFLFEMVRAASRLSGGLDRDRSGDGRRWVWSCIS